MKVPAWLPILAAAIVGIQLGAAITVTRLIAADVPPATIALIRYLIGAACMAPFLFRIDWRAMPWRDFFAISALGIGQFGILVALLNYGLITVPAGRGAVLFSTVPVLALVLSVIFRGERLRLVPAIGVVLTIVGVAVAVSNRDDWAGGVSTGDLVILASALIGATTSVLYSPYVARYKAFPLGAFAMAASVAFLVGPSIYEGALPDLVLHPEPRIWGALIFVGLSSAVAFGLWLWALGHTTPTRVTMFFALGPVAAALLSAFWLGEHVTVPVQIGLVLVVAGLVVARRR